MFVGQVTIPDKESKKFSSFIGNLDPRVKLNETIKYGDNRYYPTLCMMASKISYENQAFVETTIKNYWKVNNTLHIYIHIKMHKHNTHTLICIF